MDRPSLRPADVDRPPFAALPAGDRSPYHAWLLRCWQERASAPAAGSAAGWRFSLEDPHTGRRRGFTSLERLVEALAHELTALAAGPGETDPPAAPARTKEGSHV